MHNFAQMYRQYSSRLSSVTSRQLPATSYQSPCAPPPPPSTSLQPPSPPPPSQPPSGQWVCPAPPGPFSVDTVSLMKPSISNALHCHHRRRGRRVLLIVRRCHPPPSSSAACGVRRTCMHAYTLARSHAHSASRAAVRSVARAWPANVNPDRPDAHQRAADRQADMTRTSSGEWTLDRSSGVSLRSSSVNTTMCSIPYDTGFGLDTRCSILELQV